ncbi:MAG: DNA-3-methyladenine glycosylase family protein [Agriterribacter sp.]
MNSATLTIPLPPLFSFKECLWFLNRNYDDCMHRLQPGSVVKAVRINNQNLVISVSASNNHMEATAYGNTLSKKVMNDVSEYITDWFDLQRDLSPFYRLLEKNKRLAHMQNEFWGLRAVGIPDLFEALIWSITGQQINLKFAYTLKRRLTEAYGTTLHFNNEPLYIFPEPQALAQLDPEALKKMQFSTSKANYIIGTAKAFASGEISKEKLSALPDFKSRQLALTQFKGIGTWTANYVLMKTMRDANAIPVGDIGLLNALTALNLIQSRAEADKIEKLFKQFSGWESYLVFYLWRSLSNPVSAGK